jgi:flavorubredoxin
MHKIKEDIFWVGYTDWDLGMFHGYSTPFGSTYNAYLIKDKFPTLIDTTKHYGFEEMLRRIKEVIDPAQIRYIISNHAEPDHSGSIDKLLKHCPQAEVVCSAKAVDVLGRYFPAKWKFKTVDNDSVLDIGTRKLKFLMMPMVHWPESMATYSSEDSILFSNDAFGQHYASSERFADEAGLDIVFREAAKYYGNIVMPYGKAVLKALQAAAGLKLDMICPSHGLIWRRKEDIEKIISLYKKWAQHQTDKRVVIVYDTMWHSTEKMAKRLYELVDKQNIPVVLINLQTTHISDIVTEILSAGVVAFGSPMLNNRVLPTMASLLMYLKGLQPKGRTALTFGSYGWSKAGFKELETSLTDAGFELAGQGCYVPFAPDEKDLEPLNFFVGLIKSKFTD